jgi:hypothetical protein
MVCGANNGPMIKVKAMCLIPLPQKEAQWGMISV